MERIEQARKMTRWVQYIFLKEFMESIWVQFQRTKQHHIEQEKKLRIALWVYAHVKGRLPRLFKVKGVDGRNKQRIRQTLTCMAMCTRDNLKMEARDFFYGFLYRTNLTIEMI